MDDYVSKEIDVDFSQVQKDFAMEAKQNQPTNDSASHIYINNDSLTFIKLKLNPNYKSKRTLKDVYLPVVLEETLSQIEAALLKEGIILEHTRSISFGKQVRVKLEKLWAEINVFYGQKGFSVVRTTKTGSSSELAELAYQVIDKELNG